MRTDEDPQFCPLCGVTLDLHEGPDSCGAAEVKARLLEQWPHGWMLR